MYGHSTLALELPQIVEALRGQGQISNWELACGSLSDDERVIALALFFMAGYFGSHIDMPIAVAQLHQMGLRLPETTIDRALRGLNDAGLISERASPDGARLISIVVVAQSV